MKWDPNRRRYVDDNGRVMRSSEVRKHVDEYITKEQKEVERQSQRLFAGAITLAAFFEFLRHKVTGWHSVAGTIAYGGETQMGDKENERINRKILSELTFLRGFEVEAERSFAAAESLASQAVRAASEKIPAGLESLVEERVAEALLRAAPAEAEAVITRTMAEVLADSLGKEEAQIAASLARVQPETAESLIGGTIPSRAQMYTEAAYSTYENNVAERETDNAAVGVRRVCAEDDVSCDECVNAASEVYVDFTDVPDIGSLTCLNNCRCSFEFSYEGVEPLTIDRRLTG